MKTSNINRKSSTLCFDKLLPLPTKAVQRQILKNFEYVHKLVLKNRELIREARSSNPCAHFDITQAVRCSEWWLEYMYGELDNAQDESQLPTTTERMTSTSWGPMAGTSATEEDITQVETFLWSTVICHDGTQFEDNDDEDIGGGPQWRHPQHEGGQSPQISFLAELCESEVIRVMQLCRGWVQRRGLTNRAGQWIYCLLALLKHEDGGPRDNGKTCQALTELVNDFNRLRLSLLMGPTKALKDKFQGTHPAKTDAAKKKCELCHQIQELRAQFTLLYLILLIVLGWQ